MADNTPQAPANAAPEAADAVTNMVTPSGDLVSVPNVQLQAAMHPVNGYRVATPQDVQDYQNQQKYGTPGQMAQTVAEGAARTATFGVVPGFGKAEDIRGRQEENPLSDIAGGILPFAAEQLIPGAGQAAGASQLAKVARAATIVPSLIGEAGEAVAGASKLTGVGAKALQYATESAIMQGGSEVSKALLKDPDSSVPNAIANEGLAALFGGALGTVAGGIGKTAGLWDSKFGAKATDAIMDKSLPDIATQELSSGMSVPSSLQGALSGDQDAYNRVQTLMKTEAAGGRALRRDIGDLYQQAEDRTLEALGADKSMVEKAPKAYDAGSELVDAIKEGVNAGKEIYGPVYDSLRSQYASIPVGVDQHAAFASKLVKAMADNDIGALRGSAEAAQMSNIFKSLDDVHNANGIKALGTGLNAAARNPELSRLGAVVGPLLKDWEASVVQNHLSSLAAAATGEVAEKASSLLASRKVADDAYKAAMGPMNDIGKALGLGRFKGANGFLRALDEKAPEQVIQRLSAKNRQDLVTMLQEKFPKAADILSKWHLNDALNDARFTDGSGLNTKKFLNNFFDAQQNAAHIQNLVTAKSPGALERLETIRNMLNALPKDGNPSNSANMIDRLWRGKIGSIAGAAVSLGGGHMVGGLLGNLSERVLNEISPFLSYKVLQIRGGEGKVVPSSVRAMFDYAKSVADGHLAVEKSVNSVFNANRDKIPPAQQRSSDSARKKLDKQVTELQKNPGALQEVAKNLQDIMPDHSTAAASTAVAALNYLASLQPKTDIGQRAILSRKPLVNPAEQAAYNRALDVAQRPLSVLNHVKNGTLRPSDVVAVKTMYPALYQNLSTKLMNQVMETVNKGQQIPYRTRLGLSLFLGQDLDSSLSQASIMAAQPLPPQQDQQQGAGPSGRPPKHSTSALDKMPGMYQTAAQNGQSRRSKQD